MKIIYIIMTHDDPFLVLRMIDRLDGPENRFLIHVDKKSSKRVFLRYKEALSRRTNVSFIPRIAVFWGDFSIVQVELNAMQFLRQEGFDYDYAVLLSGTHYPIKSKEIISKYFTRHKGSIFLENRALTAEDPSHPWRSEEGGMDRVLYWHFTRYPWLEKLVSWRICPFLKKKGLDWLLKRKYKFGLKFYGLSQWWCLDKQAIDYILDFVDKNRKFVSFFKFAHVADEIFIQTILLNSPHKARVINDNLLFIKWQTGRKSPCILSSADLSSLRQSDKLFARKFECNAEQGLFDEIDRMNA